jgi:CRISPR/Cas system CSM-associated protein Csm2 small subunit
MDNTEAQQLLFEIVNQAQNQKFTEFRLITSWVDFRLCRKNHLATRLIINMLKDSARNLFNAYCKDIKSGTQDLQQLLAYTEIREITAFYEKELETLKKMLDEYDDWLGQGHFWYSFLGGERDIWN